MVVGPCLGVEFDDDFAVDNQVDEVVDEGLIPWEVFDAGGVMTGIVTYFVEVAYDVEMTGLEHLYRLAVEGLDDVADVAVEVLLHLDFE